MSKGTHFVRITADCPLIDFNIIDKAIEICVKKFDYVSNTVDRTYPDGLDVEVFKRSSVEAYLNSKHPFLKEHVTPYIHGNVPKSLTSGNFTIYQLKNKHNFSNFRWTLDVKEDFIFLNKVCKNSKIYDSWECIKSIIFKNPTLLEINNQIKPINKVKPNVEIKMKIKVLKTQTYYFRGFENYSNGFSNFF